MNNVNVASKLGETRKISLVRPCAVLYYVPVERLKEARDWYTSLFDIQVYMERDLFISCLANEFELCFHAANDKAGPGVNGQTAYWEVADIAEAITVLTEAGATPYRRLLEVEEGGFVIQLKDPFGNLIGLREKHPVSG